MFASFHVFQQLMPAVDPYEKSIVVCEYDKARCESIFGAQLLGDQTADPLPVVPTLISNHVLIVLLRKVFTINIIK